MSYLRLAPLVFKYGYKYGKKLFKYFSKSRKRDPNYYKVVDEKAFFRRYANVSRSRPGDLSYTVAAVGGVAANVAVGAGVYAFAKNMSTSHKRARASETGKGNASDATMNYSLGGGTVQVGQDVHFSKSNSKYGRSSGSLKGRALQKMVKMATQTATYRLQSLADFGNLGTELSLKLDVKTTVVPPVGEVPGYTSQIDLPMYCINLSANPAIAGGRVLFPCYRAQKKTPLGYPLDRTVKNYTWINQQLAQNLPDGLASHEPQLESSTQVVVPSSTYRHDWSNIQLLFNCARHNPCTIHVAIVKWVGEAGPNTETYLAGEGTVPFYDDPDPASEEQADIDVFWESFWAPRIVHPLSSFPVPDKSKHLKFLKHERIVVNDNGNPNDYVGTVTNDNPTMHLKKLFFRNGSFFNMASNKSIDDTVGDILPPVSAGPLGVFGHRPGAYNAFVRQEDPDYLNDRWKDTWLLVWADHFPDHISSGPLNQMKHCTFDFKIRSQYTSIV